MAQVLSGSADTCSMTDYSTPPLEVTVCAFLDNALPHEMGNFLVADLSSEAIAPIVNETVRAFAPMYSMDRFEISFAVNDDVAALVTFTDDETWEVQAA